MLVFQTWFLKFAYILTLRDMFRELSIMSSTSLSLVEVNLETANPDVNFVLSFFLFA